MIADERERQISQEGWSIANDEQYTNDELLMAAACYMSATATYDSLSDVAWPWDEAWWKPGNPVDKVRCLAKAGALIAAEIDRLQRMETTEESSVDQPETP